jgi:hypothetical protein
VALIRKNWYTWILMCQHIILYDTFKWSGRRLFCICHSILLFFLFSFYFIIFTFTYMCIPPLSLLNSPASGLNLFRPLILRFCWRERIIDNEKDMSFLLVTVSRHLCIATLFTTFWSPSHFIHSSTGSTSTTFKL